ncbi:MAG TPA: ABC transporter substrate-binding protein [Candidatus Binatia bacterium]|jgi:putative ABC transport system substrate-binding protein
MKRNVYGLTLCTLLFALSYSASAQQPKKIPRIGVLSAFSPSSELSRLEAFRQGLRELGYIEGQNIVIEYRYGEGNRDRARELAAELERLKVDLIVAAGGSGLARVAKETTKTIPIIMTGGSDPIGAGLVASLARPGGNITGLTAITAELAGKRLELLKETLPRLTRVGVLWNPMDQGSDQGLKEIEIAAPTLGLEVRSLQVRNPSNFESAFKAAIAGQSRALQVLPSGLVNSQHNRIVEFATKSRLPTMFAGAAQVEAGGLMSYGPNAPDLYRRAATYVDKILKGAKPSDLPVEQPTKFELVINLKTAKQIGITIPPNVLARADKVIR